MNFGSVSALPWLVGLVLVLAALIILRRPISRLWRLFLRSTGSLAVLAVLGQIGHILGISLGVNWLNAFVLGLLGLPGFGLLLLLQWVLQTP